MFSEVLHFAFLPQVLCVFISTSAIISSHIGVQKKQTAVKYNHTFLVIFVCLMFSCPSYLYVHVEVLLA